MQRPRRRRVPAFGEWNYSYSDEPWLPAPTTAGGVNVRCHGATSDDAEPEACSEAWFSYSPPPPHKQSRKKLGSGGGGGGPSERTRRSGEGRMMKASIDGGSRVATTPAKAAGMVRCPVDADLYQVPPPDKFVVSDYECHSRRSRARKRAGRSMWKGCLGLNNCLA